MLTTSMGPCQSVHIFHYILFIYLLGNPLNVCKLENVGRTNTVVGTWLCPSLAFWIVKVVDKGVSTVKILFCIRLIAYSILSSWWIYSAFDDLYVSKVSYVVYVMMTSILSYALFFVHGATFMLLKNSNQVLYSAKVSDVSEVGRT